MRCYKGTPSAWVRCHHLKGTAVLRSTPNLWEWERGVVGERRGEKERKREKKREEGRGEERKKWLGGKESSCQCGGHGFKPWSEKIPYTAKHHVGTRFLLELNPWATAVEPVLQSPGAVTPEAPYPKALLHNRRNHRHEKTVPLN